MFDTYGHVGFVTHTRLAGFVEHLRAGRLVTTRCLACGAQAVPPRADCVACLGEDFEWVEIDGAGTLFATTTVVAPPAGFEEVAPYTLGIVELDVGARLMGIVPDAADLVLGQRVRLLPRVACPNTGVDRVLLHIHPEPTRQ